MYEGKAILKSVNTIGEFGEFLDSTKNNEAVTYGCPDSDSLLTIDQNLQAGYISRTREYFKFRDQPGIMMLDIDGCDKKPDEVRAILLQSSPWLTDVEMLWRASSSSGIQDCGLKGQRFYFFVDNSKNIPRIGKRLEYDLWKNGHGYILIGKVGQLLTRCLVDVCVWQPERIDFVSQPILGEGVTRTQYKSIVFPGKILNSTNVPNKTEHEEKELKSLIVNAKLPFLREAKEKQLDHCEAMSKKTGINVSTYLKVYDGVLPNDLVLHPQFGDPITVSELLKNINYWDHKQFADPLDPTNRNDNRVAKFIADRKNKTGYIYSFAHGFNRWVLSQSTGEVFNQAVEVNSEVNFELSEDQSDVKVPVTISVINKENTVNLLELILSKDHFWNDGAGLVTVTEDNKIISLSQAATKRSIEERVDAYRWFKGNKSEEPEWRRCEIPNDYIEQIHQAGTAKSTLNKLEGVSDIPIIYKDTIISAPGYNKETKYFLKKFDMIDMTPEKGLEILLDLVSEFKFNNQVSKISAVSAIMTGVFRSAWDSAPGYLITAPRPGSGKTYLGEVIGAITTGKHIPTTAIAYDHNDIKKHIFSEALMGTKVILYDNLTRDIPNADALNSIISSGLISDRILGESRTAVAGARVLIVCTGNNIYAREDAARRYIEIRIDTKTAKTNSVIYSKNAKQEALEKRNIFISACFAIRKAYVDHKPGLKKTSDFVEWQNDVRIPLYNVSGIDCLSGMLDQRDQQETPVNVAEILSGVWENRKNAPFTISDLMNMNGNLDMADAINNVCGDGKSLSSYSKLSPLKLSHWIRSKIDYIDNGLVIRLSTKKTHNKVMYYVEQIQSEQDIVTISEPEVKKQVKKTDWFDDHLITELNS
jgi:hypothetical protein